MITEKEIIQTYREYREKSDKIALTKIKDLDKLYKEAESAVVREEYCIGSDMFLGYYNPSPVYDLIVGNMRRGKLSDKCTKLQKPTHQYGFDENGKLVVVNRIMPKEESDYDEYAVLEYNDNIVTIIGVCKIGDDTEINTIALCEYDTDGRLVKLTEGYEYSDEGGFTSVYQEVYKYNNSLIDTLTMLSCGEITEDYAELTEIVAESFRKYNDKEIADQFIDSIERTGCLCGFMLYQFFHDENGCITGCEVVDEYGRRNTYKVPKRKRRKV